MFYIEDRHDYPHAKREVEGRGILRAYDPYCAECARVGFCTWCQGPCKVDGPALTVPAAFAKLRENPFVDSLISDAAKAQEIFGDDELERYANEFSQDSDEPAGPIFSWTTACPTCGEVHPV